MEETSNKRRTNDSGDGRSGKVPVWKWLALFAGLSALGPVLGAQPSFLYAFVIAGLMLFPGNQEGAPRLFRVLPWLWLLNGFTGVVLLLDRFLSADGKGRLFTQPEMQSIPAFELFSGAIVLPIGFWIFRKAPRWASAFLVVSWAVAILTQALGLIDERTPSALVDWIVAFVVDGGILAYLRSRPPLRGTPWWPRGAQ